jgi:hypothetical protein
MAIIKNNLSVHEVTDDYELHHIWPSIRHGINTINIKCNTSRTLPEDIYHGIKNKNLKLLVGTIDNKYEGFFVIKYESYPDGMNVHTYMAHNNGNDKDFLVNFSDILYDIAKEIGAVRLTYTSNRKGWLKTCKKMKCKPTVQIYEREVVQ